MLTAAIPVNAFSHAGMFATNSAAIPASENADTLNRSKCLLAVIPFKLSVGRLLLESGFHATSRGEVGLFSQLRRCMLRISWLMRTMPAQVREQLRSLCLLRFLRRFVHPLRDAVRLELRAQTMQQLVLGAL